MASVQHSCTLCKEDSLVVPAVSWCPECESFLCLDCDRHHTRSKTSKHHTTVSVDAYQNLLNDVKNVTNVCKDHAQSQEFYCPKHDCACCLQCFNDNHTGCGEIKRLTEIVKNIKSSERVTILEFNLDFLKKDYDVILKHMRERMGNVNVDELKGISKIKTMRSEVNRYMDIVEQTLIDKLKAECENIKTATMKLKEEVEESRSSIDGTQTKLKAVVGNATNLQIYNFLESLEVKTEYELKRIEQLKKKREMVTTKIEVKISNALGSFFNEIGNFGNVNVGVSNSNLTFVTGNTSAVQNATVSVSSAVDINDVHVTSFNTFSIPTIVCTNPDITGCAVLDNDIVLLDWNNKQMYRFTSNRSFLKVACSFPDHPSSICRVNEHTVAVTVPTAKTLSFINVTNGKTTYEKKMDGECYGVSCDGKEIVVSVINDKKTTVVIMDINGKHISAFDLDNENWICVYRWKDRIYLSNWSTNKIVCCKQYGDILWEYGNENLENPLDIAVVDRGIVLVACRKSNAIVVLSPNGKESKVLLSEKDGIHDPIALSVNNNNGRIFVTNGTNNSFSCFTVSTKKQVDG